MLFLFFQLPFLRRLRHAYLCLSATCRGFSIIPYFSLLNVLILCIKLVNAHSNAQTVFHSLWPMLKLLRWHKGYTARCKVGHFVSVYFNCTNMRYMILDTWYFQKTGRLNSNVRSWFLTPPGSFAVEAHCPAPCISSSALFNIFSSPQFWETIDIFSYIFSPATKE